MQKKEKADKDLVVRVQPSLFKKFEKKCREKYRSVSEVIRELMLHYTTKDEKTTNR